MLTEAHSGGLTGQGFPEDKDLSAVTFAILCGRLALIQ